MSIGNTKNENIKYKKLKVPFSVPEDIDEAINHVVDSLNKHELISDCYITELNSLLNGCDTDMQEEDISILREYYCRGGIYGRTN